MVLDKSTLLKYYKRRDVQEALVLQARDKEIGFRYGDGFGKRPDVLLYPQDVMEVALRGVSSFHASEELWLSPLRINSEMNRRELDGIRSGWDLLLDIDCVAIEYSKICAQLVVSFLKYCDCDSFSIKFSGNKGFHIGVPFEAFPSRIGEIETRLLFPEAPRKIAFYVKENIKDALARRILEFELGDVSKVAIKVGLPTSDIIKYENKDGVRVGILDVEKFLEIDTVLLTSRHLYRMAYSLHEKSGLISLPISVDQLAGFDRSQASIKLLSTTAPLAPFMSRSVRLESARRLLTQAFDYEVKIKFDVIDERKNVRPELVLAGAIPREFFPPCMQKIDAGISDGRKRALFCAIHYLGKIGWSREQINVWVADWNSRQVDPLREVYLKGQMAHFVPGERLCPNCNSEAYYKGIGVCNPDLFCRKIKNPVNYTLLKFRNFEEQRKVDEEKIRKELRRAKKKKVATSGTPNSASEINATVNLAPITQSDVSKEVSRENMVTEKNTKNE